MQNARRVAEDIAKFFEIDGKPYGSSCANKIIGKELTAPVWLYELAETWFQDEMKDFKGMHQR